MKHIVIGRQYGSGGRDIGKIVGEKLNLPVYDKELITLASQKSGVSEGYLNSLDEQGTANFFTALAQSANLLANSYMTISMNDQLFLLQSDIISQLAKKGPSVFVGRSADYVLKGTKHLSVFIHAPLEYRIKKVAKREKISENEAKALVARVDRKRKSYYRHYTGRKWGDMQNFHLTLDSSVIPEEEIVKIIIEAYNAIN